MKKLKTLILLAFIGLNLFTNAQKEETKTLTMTFEGYEEGDLNHLMFKDCETKMDYDFTKSSLNNLSDIPILINNPEAEYGDGYKANPEYLNKKFIVNMKKTKCLESEEPDGGGETYEVMEWVITSLELKK